MSQATSPREFAVGDTIGPAGFGPITLTDIVRYQGASGDFQPVHHDPAFAAGAGLPQPLVIGMLPAGLVAGWLSASFGADNVRYFRVRWSAPVWPGDTLTATGTVARLYADEEGGKIDIDVSCVNQDGQAALSCAMTFLLQHTQP